MMFGIINKLTPQIPVYFISQPFVLAGGFLLVYFTVAEFLQIFIAAFSSWLRHG
jgi:flagellar biosynthetic protein FliR